MTEAERVGAQSVAKSMTVRDLQWQINNAKKLRIPADMNKIFKDELASRKAN